MFSEKILAYSFLVYCRAEYVIHVQNIKLRMFFTDVRLKALQLDLSKCDKNCTEIIEINKELLQLSDECNRTKREFQDARSYFWSKYNKAWLKAKNLPWIEDKPERPPKYSELILYFVLPKEDREPFIGDLNEQFHENMVPRFGVRSARMWYRWEVVKSVAPLIQRRIEKAIRLIGRLARVAEWLDRIVGN